MLVPDLLNAAAKQHPDRLAVVVVDTDEMTYAQWNSASDRIASHLVESGVQPGDPIALLMPNAEACIYLCAYVAIHKAGGVAVPINTRFTETELSHVIGHCRTQLALVCATLVDKLQRAAPKLPRWIDTDALRQIAVHGPAMHTCIVRPADALADILYTSGTTGTPKGVACTHDNISFKGSSTLSDAFSGARLLHAVPLFTFAGIHAMSLICLRGAMTQILLARFDPGVFLDALVRYRVRLAYAVPAMILRCLAHPRLSEGGFDRLQLLMYGTAPMPPTAIQDLATHLPNTLLINLYGLTEGGAAVCSLPPHEALNRPGSVGRPLPPTQLRIFADDGTEVDANTIGEICLKAPIRNRWYFRDESATAQTWDSSGWLHTGDLGYIDADGYLYLVDRKKDLIIVGGHNVSAPEVEGVLIAHPSVRDAAVVGVHHPVMGEVPKGFVVLHEGATIDLSELVEHLAGHLADYKVPRQVDVVDALPRNALGKVLKRVLRGERPESCEAAP